MTDSNSAPSHSSSTGPPDYEGTDPDLLDREPGEKPRVSVSTVQVGASAAAAVTSALAASFFGVAGTLIGAAVGSIVSTIAGELYKHYLAQAGERIKGTTNVVIQRLPSEVIATTPLRHLTNPSDLPGRESLQPIGNERGDESISVPVESAGRLRQHPEGMAPLAAQNGSRVTSAPRPSPWRKPLLAMAGISAAGFLIALGLVLATETAIGHPVSGGDSGTTISRLGSNDSSKSEVKPTESVTEAPTPSDGASVDPAEPTASADPTATEGGTGSGTGEQPTEQSTDPAATDPGSVDSGSDSGDSGSGDTTGQGAAEATQAP
jgi:hypothetical protein